MQNVSTVFGKQKLSTEYAVWVFLNRYLGDEMPALATDLVHLWLCTLKKKLPIKEKSNSNLLKSS